MIRNDLFSDLEKLNQYQRHLNLEIMSLENDTDKTIQKQERWEESNHSPYIAITGGRAIYVHCHTKEKRGGETAEERREKIERCSAFLVKITIDILGKHAIYADGDRDGQPSLVSVPSGPMTSWIYVMQDREKKEIMALHGEPKLYTYPREVIVPSINKVWLENKDESHVPVFVSTEHGNLFYHIHGCQDRGSAAAAKCAEVTDQIGGLSLGRDLKQYLLATSCKTENVMSSNWDRILALPIDEDDLPEIPLKEKAIVPIDREMEIDDSAYPLVRYSSIPFTSPEFWHNSDTSLSTRTVSPMQGAMDWERVQAYEQARQGNDRFLLGDASEQQAVLPYTRAMRAQDREDPYVRAVELNNSLDLLRVPDQLLRMAYLGEVNNAPAETEKPLEQPSWYIKL